MLGGKRFPPAFVSGKGSLPSRLRLDPVPTEATQALALGKAAGLTHLEAPLRQHLGLRAPEAE